MTGVHDAAATTPPGGGRESWPRGLAWPLPAAGSAAAILLHVKPMFGPFATGSVGGEFVNRLAIVVGALDTWKSTGALPISTDTIYPGVEYPLYLFESPAFYLLASGVSAAVGVPVHLGIAITLGAALAVGNLGMFALGRGVGLPAWLAAALASLYTVGPYSSLNLFMRFAYPEYMTWQLLPALLFVLRWSLTRSPRASPSIRTSSSRRIWRWCWSFSRGARCQRRIEPSRA
jgi:hypothetical protein